jgi:hypothetical protein
MSSAADSLVVDIRKQDDLRYRWTLSRPDGRVVEEGVELYIASCLVAATASADPAGRISIVVVLDLTRFAMSPARVVSGRRNLEQQKFTGLSLSRRSAARRSGA